MLQQAIDKMEIGRRALASLAMFLSILINSAQSLSSHESVSYPHTQNFIDQQLKISPQLSKDDALFTLRNLSDIIISSEFNPVIKSIVNQLMGQMDEFLLDNDDSLDETEMQEKLIFLTSSTNGTAVLSFAGLIYTLLWILAMGVISSMILCYWLGCEYEDSTETTTSTSSYGRSFNSLAKYVNLSTFLCT